MSQATRTCIQVSGELSKSPRFAIFFEKVVHPPAVEKSILEIFNLKSNANKLSGCFCLNVDMSWLDAPVTQTDSGVLKDLRFQISVETVSTETGRPLKIISGGSHIGLAIGLTAQI